MATQARRAWLPGSRVRRAADGRMTSQLEATLLPDELESNLSALANRYQRVRADDDVLLIDATTSAVIDVLRDIRPTI